MSEIVAKHCQELERIANVEDYMDESDAAEDGAILLGIALDFEAEIKRLDTEVSGRRIAMQDIKATIPWTDLVCCSEVTIAYLNKTDTDDLSNPWKDRAEMLEEVLHENGITVSGSQND